MKMLRIPLVIALLVAGGRGFDAGAQTVTNLFSFAGFPVNGDHPYCALIQDSNGNFYSTTEFGGTNSCNCGTVFRISPSGSFTSLYSFAGTPTDGADPWAALVWGNDGNFYSTASEGGAYGSGTVYRISPGGNYTNLYSFGAVPNDGADPWAAMVLDADGDFYGTTPFGGTHNSGTVFRISSSGNETNLYSFGTHRTDGSGPYGGLALGADGNFYGTASGGGTHNSGVVFRVSPSGGYTNLYSFGGAPNDGSIPYDPALVQASDGNFYGSTVQGGAGSCNCGIVFRISPGGSYSNLHTLSSNPARGAFAGLMQGSDGNFYGPTIGSIFSVTPAGTLTTLDTLPMSDGDVVYPNVIIQGSDGNFYGTTGKGGTSGVGFVYRLSVPLNPPPFPINQITGAQVSGTNVVFNIPSIENEIYQLQFSSSLTPTNWVNTGGSITSIGSTMTLTNVAGASPPQGFYRFDITP
jgi:uncharacterized repeat protein (TIGR03803 family)